MAKERLLPETRTTILGVAEAWKTFQTLFSRVYDAIKTGKKIRGRMSEATISESALGYGFAFSGSVGVVMTIPSETLLIGESNLTSAAKIMLGLPKARTSERLGQLVNLIGVPPIVALDEWAEAHAKNGFGAGIEWKSQKRVIESVLVQRLEFAEIHSAIHETKDVEQAEYEISGELKGADVSAKTFHFVTDLNEDIRGEFTNAISVEQTVELPKRYKVLLRRTTKRKEATQKEEEAYMLVEILK